MKEKDVVVFLGLMERAFPEVFFLSTPLFKACDAQLGKHRPELDAADIPIFLHWPSYSVVMAMKMLARVDGCTIEGSCCIQYSSGRNSAFRTIYLDGIVNSGLNWPRERCAL